MSDLAWFYQIEGKYEQAEPLYQRSLMILEKNFGQDIPNLINTLNHLGDLYFKQGKYEQAEALYQRSLTISKNNHFNVGSSLNRLTVFYLAQNKHKLAEPIFKRTVRTNTQDLENLLWGTGEKIRQFYLQNQNRERDAFLTFCTLHNLAEEALYFSLARKGLLLRIETERNALAKNSHNPAIQKELTEFNQLKSQLSNLGLSGKADKVNIKNLEEKLNLLEIQLNQKLLSFKRSKTEVTPKEVLEKLKPEQALIDFLVYKEVNLETNKGKTDQVIALVAGNKNGIKLIKLGELAPIAKAIKTYRQNILPDSAGQLANRNEILNPTSQKLYSLILQPLLPYLANKTEVYLIPDGILHLLPFKALQDKQGHYLAEKRQITLLTSARDIVLPPLAATTSDSVIIAAPAFGNKGDKAGNNPNRSIATRREDIYFAPLEGAAAEGKALSELIETEQSVQFFQDEQATEASVDGIKSPRFLHFATHGFFLENLPQSSATSERGLMQESTAKSFQLTENPLTRSGLALTGANSGIAGKKQADGTDGILTALEVLALHLEGTDLVTLSACETGVGDIQVGEGVYSLNRAFQEAGAKSVLSTLWSVADEQTKLFMQEFYSLVLNGMSPQQALQKTQLKFIKDKTIQDPFFWAAFTVVGI